VESTVGGTFTEVNELFVATDLKVVGEIRLPIHCCLLGLPEGDPEDLRVVYSHRQALALCQSFLESKRLEARPYHDMAAAAKMLVQERPEGSAAIASSYCAEYYHLQVLAENIEDFPGNVTRFLVVARDEVVSGGNKCSIIFVAEHKAGALFKILQVFADAGINLTRIESMPNRRDPGNYVFFMDFFGSPEEPRVAGALAAAQSRTSFFKFLGCYPAGEAPPPPEAAE
jgi:prephenate dehydratase/chorismate mutase/prephenate dehydratase